MFVIPWMNLCLHILWFQDDPCFLLHFDKVRTVTATSCSAKYAIVRSLVALSDQHCQRTLNLQNFDWAYIKPTSFYSNRGDCVVLSQICFYAFNLVCLSMCPVPLDAWGNVICVCVYMEVCVLYLFMCWPDSISRFIVYTLYIEWIYIVWISFLRY